ncbi:hypothetical protein L873DRAFT_1725876 [Choiromyces venosus 120613-1]|uniref:Uncharacterized protein n=1 Tax=Choiromyces venosus 120613-1 TaxID=1336337 RepID=A0A3N4ISX6_9PEZI|nr:hypothetical protein L873DRAFT_1725876 [Choiromyces venosus 120613-1]
MFRNSTDVKVRVEEACYKLKKSEKLNIIGVACEFGVPKSLLSAKWKGRQPQVNKRLTKAEELTVYMYLKWPSIIGTSAQLPIVSGCTNNIL